MKKITVLLLMLSLLLSGCCLQHDWVDATCNDPKICSKCEETEGEALGHDWVEANCVEHERCIRCEATKGEALGHTAAEWKAVSDSTMAAHCDVCGREVEQDLDREILAMQDILGKWTLVAISSGGVDGEWESLRDTSIWVEFLEDGKMRYDIVGQDEGTYRFDRYSDGYNAYWYYTQFDDGYCEFRLDEDGELYWVADKIWMCFER